MVCDYCGARYRKNMLQCPSCHSENLQEAKRKKKRILEGFDKEAAEIKKEAKKYPINTANRMTKYLVCGICVALIMGGIIIVISMFLSSVFTKRMYAKEKANITKLEAYLSSGDYAGLSNYMYEEDLYSSSYDRFSEIWKTYDCLEAMNRAKRNADEIIEHETFSEEEKWNLAELWVECYIEEAKSAILLTQEYTQDKIFYGNEEMLLDLEKEVIDKLREAGFTQEEIDRICVEEIDSLMNLKKRVYSRWIS